MANSKKSDERSADEPSPGEIARALAAALRRGTSEHYADALLYDHDYRRRRMDVQYYLGVAAELARGPILELGCGSGRITVPLARNGHEVVGVDLSRTMLARARERVATLPEKRRALVELQQGDFRDLALGRRFSLVICPFNAVMHLYERADFERFADVVKRHLAPGGHFVFDVLLPDLRWLSRDPRRRWGRTRFRDPKTGTPMIYSTNHFFDDARQICFMQIYYEPEVAGTAPSRTVRLAHRYFFPQELADLLHYNGFAVDKHVRDFAESDLVDLSGGDQQILWCRLAAGSARKTRSRR